MAARQGTPGLAVLAERTCSVSDRRHPKLWTVGAGYRYQPSYRHFIGTVEQMVETLQRRREEFGVSYLQVFFQDIDAFAPVVARLAGT